MPCFSKRAPCLHSGVMDIPRITRAQPKEILDRLESEELQGRCTKNFLTFTGTLHDAILHMENQKKTFVAISYKAEDKVESGEHEFRICRDLNNGFDQDSLDPGYVTRHRILPVEAEVDQEEIVVSFQSPEYGFSDSNYIIDTGKPYGEKSGGYTYGWNCPQNTFTLDTGRITSLYSGVEDLQEVCENEDRKTWTLSPMKDGMYEAQLYYTNYRHTGDIGMCTVANQHTSGGRMTFTSDVKGKTVDHFESSSFPLEIKHGKLVFRSEFHCGEHRCMGVSQLKLKPLQVEQMEDRRESWLPPSKDPWKEIEFEKSTPIARVTIKIFRECSLVYFYM